jgi:hypothetical protein
MKSSVIFGKCRILRYILEVIGLFLLIIILLVSHLFVGLTLGFLTSDKVDGRERINMYFGGLINPNNVVKYKFEGAWGDTVDYWKLKNIDANACQLIIRNFNFKPIQDNDLMSVTGSPRWWPKSEDSYLIYENSDEDGGREELWIPKEGSNAYIFKFVE